MKQKQIENWISITMVNFKILLFFFILSKSSFCMESEYQDSTKIMINDNWKMNVISLGFGMPNLGQFDNNKPFKAVVLMVMKHYWVNEFKVSKINQNISDRNRSFWWLFLLNFYGIVDSYVDENLKDFPENTNSLQNGEE